MFERILNCLFPIVLLALSGYGMNRAVLRRLGPVAGDFLFVASFATGMGFCTLLFLLQLVIWGRLEATWAIGLTVGAGLMGFLASAPWRSGLRPGAGLSGLKSKCKRLSAIDWVLILLLCSFGAHFFADALRHPLLGYDARTIYAFKAKIFFHEHSISGPAFTDPNRVHLHRDYPLLLSLLQFAIFEIRGRVDERAAMFLAPTFHLLTVVTLIATIRQMAGLRTALSLSLLYLALPLYLSQKGTGANTGGADMPFTFFSTLCVASFVMWVHKKRPAYAAIGACACAFSIMTKTEGTLLWAALAASGVMCWIMGQVSGRPSRLRLRPFSIALFGALLLCLPWFAVKANVPNFYDETYGDALLNASFAGSFERIPIILRMVGTELGDPEIWGNLWKLYFVLLIVAVFSPIYTSTLFLDAIVIASVGAYFFVYMITPLGLEFHIATSANRLMAHLAPIVILRLGASAGLLRVVARSWDARRSRVEARPTPQRRSLPNLSPIPRPTLVLIVAIVGLGLALRLFNLGSQSLWLDEILSVIFTAGEIGDIFSGLGAEQLPLFFWLLWPLEKLTLDEGVLRLVPLLWGVALLPILYQIGRTIGRPRAGIAAMSLAAIMPFSVHYSQELRMYSLLTFESLLATWALLRFLAAEERRELYVWGGILGMATLSAAYTSPFAFPLIPIYMGLAWMQSWRRRNHLAVLRLYTPALAIAMLPVFLHILPVLTGEGYAVQSQGGEGEYDNLFHILTRTLVGFSLGSKAFALFFLSAVTLGGIWLWRASRTLVVVSIFLLGLPLLGLYVLKPEHFFHIRYLSYSFAHLVLLAGASIDALIEALTRKSRRIARDNTLGHAMAAGLSFMIFGLLLLVPLKDTLFLERTDWKAIAELIRAELRPADTILVHPFYNDNSILYTLDRVAMPGERVRLTQESSYSWYRSKVRRDDIDRNAELFAGPEIALHGFTSPEEIEQIIETTSRVWIITSSSEYADDFTSAGFGTVWTQGRTHPIGGPEHDPLHLLYRGSPAGAPARPGNAAPNEPVPGNTSR